MFNKINNRLLTILFIVLLGLVVVIFFINSDKNERTFRDKLVDIDTTAVTEMIIHSRANNFEPLKIFKEKNKWFVNLKNGKTAAVPDAKMTQSFNELAAVKPKRLASRMKEKWGDFQVDSTGVRVQIFEGSKSSLDIVLGRFNYQQQPRQVSTYVRLYNDNDVYEVDGFLALTFNQDADAFRDGTIIKADYNTWNNLKFEYPSDSSFTLTKLNGKWSINNIETDSAKTVNYLKRIATLSNNNFADDFELMPNMIPVYNLTIGNENLQFIEVSAYVDSLNYIVTSSQRPDALFDGKTFGNTLFVNKGSFY
jgi:hypothetical protein